MELKTEVIAAPVPHPVTVTAKIPATPLPTQENPTPKAAPVTVVATAVPDFEVIPSKEQPTQIPVEAPAVIPTTDFGLARILEATEKTMNDLNSDSAIYMAAASIFVTATLLY